ncbi:MAG: PhzF family phenazine biosynthesis protein [Chloroflexota bacterium]
MTRRFRFRQVDVFTDRPLAGNPLAVFPEAEGLTDDEMQALAREMNVSETCFVLPPTPAGAAEGAAYRVRIFTPGVELPFAGHPSVGTAWLLASEGRFPLSGPVTEVRQELPIGVLPLTVAVGPGDPPRIGDVTMTHDVPDRYHDLDEDETEELCEALEVAPSEIGWPASPGGRGRRRGGPTGPAVISTGLPHLVIPFKDRAVMMDVDHERRAYVAELADAYDCDSAALVAPGTSGAIADATVSVRIFDSAQLRIEADPATGAAAGPIAVLLGGFAGCRSGTFRVVIEQGAELGRPSRLVAEADFDGAGRPVGARVAGSTVPVIEGWVTLP